MGASTAEQRQALALARSRVEHRCGECGRTIRGRDASAEFCRPCLDERIRESKRRWWHANHGLNTRRNRGDV